MIDATFDVYIRQPVGLGHEPQLGQEARTGWIELGADLAGARALARRVHEQRGTAYVVPAAYREPRLTVAQATEIARRRHTELVEAGRRLAELPEPYDDLLWWTFEVADLDAQAEWRIPGTERIAVDKLDGSLRTEEQYQEWLRLTNPRLGQEPSPQEWSDE